MAELSYKKDGSTSPPGDSDAELVVLSKKGDTAAFEVLVKSHQKRVFNIAYRMTGDYEEASEVVQDVFLSAFRSIKTFRGDAKFSTWLYGITVNITKNRMKRVKVRSLHENQSIDDPEVPQMHGDSATCNSYCLSGLEELERKELQEKVQECISSLDTEYREALILRDIQGFSYEEIRDILNIPEGTVKSRIFRARDILRERLKIALGAT